MKKLTQILFALLAIGLLSGCATSRSVLPVNAAPAYHTANPESGPEVHLTTTDARSFELKPATPDIPSLKNGEVTNTAITSRAFARKRNSYGRAMGDVLLPEGQTVAQTVQDTVADAFRAAGYRVVTSSNGSSGTPLPVNIEVNQYWSWVNFGFWEGSVICRAEITVKAPLSGFEEGNRIKVEAERPLQVVTEDDWQKVASDGLTKLRGELSRQLSAASPSS